MFRPSHKVVLGILASVLVAATGLWSLFAYWPDRLSFTLSGRLSDATRWGTLLILAIGLAVGWATRWCLIGRKELPGGVWTALAAGVVGAWLGGTFLGNWGWVWERVNLIGSLVIALVLAWGGGRILAYLQGREKRG